MAAASGICNRPVGEVNQATNLHPTSNAAKTGSNGGDESKISSNDFLTLLVTEMKNQDPTASTDPNQYINQLVQVNSLEQLININQNLATVLGVSPQNSDHGPMQGQDAAMPQVSGSGNAIGSNAAGPAGVALGILAEGSGANPAERQIASGNLGVPATTPAAERVAEALGSSNRVR